jgi:chromosome segregation ATPase
MAATLRHVCSRKSDTDPNPFPFRNDANNVTALQSARRQKKLMEDSARVQQQKLDEVDGKLRNTVEDKEKVTKERDDLQREKDKQQAIIDSLTDKISGLEKKLMEEATRLQQQKSEADGRLRNAVEDNEKVTKERDHPQHNGRNQRAGNAESANQ